MIAMTAQGRGAVFMHYDDGAAYPAEEADYVIISRATYDVIEALGFVNFSAYLDALKVEGRGILARLPAAEEDPDGR